MTTILLVGDYYTVYIVYRTLYSKLVVLYIIIINFVRIAV